MKLSLTKGTDGGVPNEVEASGLALDLGADGSLRARAERLVLHSLRLQAGPFAVEVAQAALSGASLVLQNGELTGLAAHELQLQGLRMVSTAAPDRTLAPDDAWRLDPIDGLDGALHAYVTDAAWTVDAEVRLPIASGRVDFDRVVVEHIGPNSSMGVSHMGVYVDGPGGRTYLVTFGASRVPGASFEQRGAMFSLVSRRGALALQLFAEALLASAGGTPIATLAHEMHGSFDRTRLAGELRLGDGVLGTARQQVTLADRARGKNRVNLSATVLSHQLMLRWPALSASGAEFELLGRRGRSGAISGSLSVQASGLGARPGRKPVRREVAVIVGELVVRELAFGDVAAQTEPARAVNAR